MAFLDAIKMNLSGAAAGSYGLGNTGSQIQRPTQNNEGSDIGKLLASGNVSEGNTSVKNTSIANPVPNAGLVDRMDAIDAKQVRPEHRAQGVGNFLYELA